MATNRRSLILWWSCIIILCAGNFGYSQSDLKIAAKHDLSEYFFLTPPQQLEYYQKSKELLYTNVIKAGSRKYPLVSSPVSMSGFSFSYRDTTRTLENFINQTNAVGIIVIRNDSILFERYKPGLGPSTKWISFSVTKSVTSLLFGAAIHDGYIHSLKEKMTDYLPELKGSEYDSVSLENLLQMASGIKWNDNANDPASDLFRINRIEKQYGWKAALDSIAHLKRSAPPGKRFNYNTIETILAGMILKNATKRSLSEYLSDKIWKPFGMHYDANWAKIEAMNLENGGGGISATLRDYALLGLYASRNGKTRNVSTLPENWMSISTTSSLGYKGYGYYWWLRPKSGRYFASGSFGQQIEIDPASNTIVAIQSYWPVAFDDYYIDYIDTFVDVLIKWMKTK